MADMGNMPQSRDRRLENLNDTLRRAREKSRFYARFLPDGPALRLRSLDELRRMPFTEEPDLSLGIEEFLCVHPIAVARIVSLQTSGSTGAPKRIAFTDADIQSIVRYFSFGMSQIVRPGERVMICLPGDSGYRVPHLLSLGIMDFGGFPTVYGPISDTDDAVKFTANLKPNCIVGIPVQVMALAERCAEANRVPRPESVLLTADYAASSLKRRISEAFGCRVFNHYGSTEMGYGGALECSHGSGLHIRDDDLYFEIIDPRSGGAMPPGQEGELVFTTLTRKGMPLIRYRTGDFASFIAAPCGCGRTSMRISSPWRMRGNFLQLPGRRLTMPELDETLFSCPQVMDYSVSHASTPRGDLLLNLRVWASGKFRLSDTSKLKTLVEDILPDCVRVDIKIAGADETSPGLLGKRLLGTVA
ncbi:MAG: AMP-binding protein [Synergistaceae bacterium]|jgi:phenylacetate-coenzyme A ligase PaaK-like adenylate-forming protein|nr:AMP-binding protein [Synergistaceae bacterium]